MKIKRRMRVGEILDNDPEDPDEDSFGMQDDMQELER